MIMVTNNNAKIFEVDPELFNDVIIFLKKLAKKKKKSFTYIDDLGDIVVVEGDKEFIIPTKEDIKALIQKQEYYDENEVKKLLCIK
ncbi:hypothetical protein NitYY0826_C0927 [Nitratiruptor sp. YY08-26]|uniref:hypothetical protein n=1 Tax=unclassified Nitratiruptor TaxID=2624044 RepID=UPI001915AA21|nr:MULTISPECIES: hypothetical protein [unclassified Nitratiruptor]BCD62058.1 hypothetical protein NitYY0813_C0925 [Nitratiruptor sp. YY08-13]BCD65994.1 hypothetical protein NitYY0826_C0927 [Nitratiruptor sp. YY08-26]